MTAEDLQATFTAIGSGVQGVNRSKMDVTVGGFHMSLCAARACRLRSLRTVTRVHGVEILLPASARDSWWRDLVAIALSGAALLANALFTWQMQRCCCMSGGRSMNAGHIPSLAALAISSPSNREISHSSIIQGLLASLSGVIPKEAPLHMSLFTMEQLR